MPSLVRRGPSSSNSETHLPQQVGRCPVLFLSLSLSAGPTTAVRRRDELPSISDIAVAANLTPSLRCLTVLPLPHEFSRMLFACSIIARPVSTGLEADVPRPTFQRLSVQ